MARTYFENRPNTTTPLRAERLNGLLNGEESIEKIVAGSIEGKNLFDVNNANIVNGYLSSTTMRIGSSDANRMFYIPCKANTTYTISRSVITSSFRVATYDSTPFPAMTSTATDYSRSNYIANNTGTSITITTGADAKYLVVHYGNTSSDTNLQESLNTIQVEIGSTVTSYVPFMKYGYNSEESMGNIVVNSIKGKNLYNISNVVGYTYSSGIPSTTSSSVVIDSFDTNNITFHTTANGYLLALLPIVQLKPNTQYTISYTRANTLVSGATARRWIYNVDNSGVYSVNDSLNSGDEGTMQYTFTTGATGKIAIAFGFSNNSSGSSCTIGKLQIEKGSEATNYTSYKTFDATAYLLWTNSSPTSEFASQTITLNDAIENYKYYEVIFRRTNSSTTIRNINSGRIPSGFGVDLLLPYYYNYIRTISSTSGTSMVIQNCNQYATYGSSTTTTSNGFIIPYQVIGYK